MDTLFTLPSLRMIAALSPRDASVLLSFAERTYRLSDTRAARQGLRRVAAYQRYLDYLWAGGETLGTGAEDGTSAEHRRAPRHDVFRLGELHLDGQPCPVDCLVREASAAGALIEVEHAVDLPDRFQLTIQTTGMSRRCQVVRRTPRCLGVAFVI